MTPSGNSIVGVIKVFVFLFKVLNIVLSKQHKNPIRLTACVLLFVCSPCVCVPVLHALVHAAVLHTLFLHVTAAHSQTLHHVL